MEFPVCTVNITVAQIAASLEVPFDTWDEPGLGMAMGFAYRLPNGATIYLEELAEVSRSRGNASTIHVDPSAFLRRNVNEVISSAIEGLGLPKSCVSWVQTELSWSAAQKIAEARRG